MPVAEREANVIWEGDLAHGNGRHGRSGINHRRMSFENGLAADNGTGNRGHCPEHRDYVS